MIDIKHSDIEDELGPVFVMSQTGMSVGVFWGTRFEICEAIDEVTDPNGCKYRFCEPGGIQFGCFHGEEEVTIADYNKARETEPEQVELRFEGTSDSGLDWLDTSDSEWLPIVPPGYIYLAGMGLTKTDSEWN